MLNVFKEIFNVELFHDYYSSGYADDLKYAPTENCRQLMKNLGMFLRKNNKGFSVSYISDSDGNAIKPFSEKIVFSFIVENLNPYFANKSKIPIPTEKNTIYYFSNLSHKGSYQTKLTRYSKVGAKDNVVLKRQSFPHKVQSVNPSVTVEIKNLHKELIKSESVIFRKDEASYPYPVDLSKHKPGLYELFVDGVSDLKFYSSNEAFKAKPFGIIEIIREGLSEKSYRIKIKKPMTYWRYFVVAKYRKEVTKDDLKLCIPKSIIEKYFRGNPKNFTYVDDKFEIEPKKQNTNSEGYNVTPIIVTQRLPLQEETITGIDLKIKTNGTNYEINDLPNPSVKNISRNEVRGKPRGSKFYSDIYIYI